MLEILRVNLDLKKIDSSTFFKAILIFVINQTYFTSKDGFTIIPPSIYNKKIWYKFKEFENLIDSTNCNVEKTNQIMFEIKKQYNSVIQYYSSFLNNWSIFTKFCVAKLSYLASKGQIKIKGNDDDKFEIRAYLTKRQINSYENQLFFKMYGYSLKKKQSSHYQKLLKTIVYSLLIAQRSQKSSVDRLQLYDFNPNFKYSDGGSILHQYCKMNTINNNEDQFILFSLQNNEGNFPIFYALQSGKYITAQILKQKGGKLITTSQRVFQAVKKQQISLLHALVKYKDPLKYKNVQQRNLAMINVITKKKEVAYFLNNFTDLFQDDQLDQKDIQWMYIKLLH